MARRITRVPALRMETSSSEDSVKAGGSHWLKTLKAWFDLLGYG